MAPAYHEAGLDHTATFELFTRRLHPKRGYWIAAGLEQALDYLEGLRVTEGQLDFGPWEQIYYAEFDGRRRKRALVKIIGE